MIRGAWPYVAALLIIAGLIALNAVLVLLGFALAIACGGAMLWARYALRGVTYERSVPEDHAFAGETIGVTLRLTNGKSLPLPWIEVHEQFPETLMVDPGNAVVGGDDEFRQASTLNSVSLAWRTSVGVHERVSRDVELQCPARGVYQIGPVHLRSGDAFGLYADERVDERRTRIIVYPRTVALPDLALPSRRPFGERRGGLRLFEDPSRIAGVRDYNPGDALRRIDWNATARVGKLQSRMYDPTRAQHLYIALNTQTLIPAWSGYVTDLLERSITVAASIARDAYDTRYAVGLLANSGFPEGDRAIRIAPGRRPEQFIRMLEALAVVTPFVLEPLSSLLDREEYRLGHGTTIAVVTAIMPGDLAATVLRLHRRGHQIVVLTTSGDVWPELLPDVPVRDVSGVGSGFAPPAAEFARPAAEQAAP
jgi:uncharacterized protein (DUF58 family)